MADNEFYREAILQKDAGIDRVRCHVCERRCVVVKNEIGWCQTRANPEGKLVTLIYGAISSLTVTPIENKPFYHFHPGTKAVTVGSWSCNFDCPWCENWDISRLPVPETLKYMSPESFVDVVERSGCQGVTLSINEPTLSLEWALDVFRLSRQNGFYNTFVTNGYLTPEALAMLVEAGLDAMNIDIKGDEKIVKEVCQGIEVEKVWILSGLARNFGVHLEMSTLLVPGVNDSDRILKGIAGRIVEELGVDIPWHVTAYQPAYKLTIPPTDPQALEDAYQIGKNVGLHHVYVANCPACRHENTVCPHCGAILAHRVSHHILTKRLEDGKCFRCHQPIYGHW
jgi:pyruvate formate lyase activating enzyme